MSFSPPLVRLCRVWVDADGSVTVSYGCVGFLHLDEDTDTKMGITLNEAECKCVSEHLKIIHYFEEWNGGV